MEILPGLSWKSGMQACDGCARAWTQLAATLGWHLLMCSSCAAGVFRRDPGLPCLSYQPWGRQVAHQSPWQLASQRKKPQPAEMHRMVNLCHLPCFIDWSILLPSDLEQGTFCLRKSASNSRAYCFHLLKMSTISAAVSVTTRSGNSSRSMLRRSKVLEKAHENIQQRPQHIKNLSSHTPNYARSHALMHAAMEGCAEMGWNGYGQPILRKPLLPTFDKPALQVP